MDPKQIQPGQEVQKTQFFENQTGQSQTPQIQAEIKIELKPDEEFRKPLNVPAEVEKEVEELLLSVLHDKRKAKRVKELSLRILNRTRDPEFTTKATRILIGLIKAKDALKKGGADGLAGALEEMVKLLHAMEYELDVSDVKGVYKLDENKLNEITRELAKEIDSMYKAILDLSKGNDDETSPAINSAAAQLLFGFKYFWFIEGVGDIICKVNGYSYCDRVDGRIVCIRRHGDRP